MVAMVKVTRQSPITEPVRPRPYRPGGPLGPRRPGRPSRPGRPARPPRPGRPPPYRPPYRPAGPRPRPMVPNPLVPRPGPVPMHRGPSPWPLMAGLLAYEIWGWYNRTGESPLSGTYPTLKDFASFHCCTVQQPEECGPHWNVRLDTTNSCGGCFQLQSPLGTAGGVAYGKDIVSDVAIGSISIGPYAQLGTPPCRARFHIAEQHTVPWPLIEPGTVIPFVPYTSPLFREVPTPVPKPMTRPLPRTRPLPQQKCKPWQTPAYNPLTRSWSCHDLQPRKHERKQKLDAGLLGDLYGGVTEIGDFIDNAIKSLPPGTCKKSGPLHVKAACVYANMHKLNLLKLIANQFLDNMQDRLIAMPGQWATKGLKNAVRHGYWNSPKGFDTGGAFRPRPPIF